MDELDQHTGDRTVSGSAGPQATGAPHTGEQPTAPTRATTASGADSDTATAGVIEPTRLTAVERLDEITGVGQRAAQTIIAEIGLDMTRFPTPEHLVSWAKLCPRTIQSGPVIRGGKTGKGNPYLEGALGEAAAAAARTNTFLGEHYRRLVKSRGKLKALVAVARSILVIVWQLVSDPTARSHDLGPDYHTSRVVTDRRIRNHIAHLTAMGFHVTVEPAASLSKYTPAHRNPAPQAPPGSLRPAHSPWVFSGQNGTSFGSSPPMQSRDGPEMCTLVSQSD
jgi:transposase